MRKSILFTILLILGFNSAFAHGGEDHGAEIEFVSLRTVKGTVTLLAKEENFPSSYSTLYKGRATSVDLTETGKVIKVTGSYDGTDTVTVDENVVFAAVVGGTDASYRFILPVIRSVIESITNASDKSTTSSVYGIFSGTIARNDKSIDSVVSQRVYAAKDFSIMKLTAKRIGNKAIVKASFAKRGSSAKGRFKLVFTP